ncbi:FecCD family ABC transporter permease [Brachybacterium sp. GCM10030268]|uniref:FecCD family ABC transporter permease n=1 Tax=Brachybacterium sp. GCM10030268 TaxID=3273382 RepID=UPI0036120F05
MTSNLPSVPQPPDAVAPGRAARSPIALPSAHDPVSPPRDRGPARDRPTQDSLGVRARDRRSTLLLLGLALAVLASLVLTMGVGPVAIPAAATWQVLTHHLGAPAWLSPQAAAAADPATDAIVWTVRLPRVLMGAAVGACLAICGATLQALVRNMLADPYILGISGGASTGAAGAILFGVGAALGDYAQGVLAFAGALGAALLVFLIARTGGRVTSLRLLLSGVAVGYALSAATNLLIFSSDSAEGSRSVMFWMLGSLSLAQWNAFLALAAAAAVLGAAVLTFFSTTLDALSAGDETAHGLGIDPDRARIGFLVVVSMCTAAAVAGAGAIGFVGLVIPHLARRVVGARHRVLIPASALLGALFLLWADALARVIMPPQELPIGVLTAAVGAPFLLVLVRRLYAQRH